MVNKYLFHLLDLLRNCCESIKRIFHSQIFNFKTAYFRLFEWLRVIKRYYIYEPWFLWIDCLLALQYLWKNPHRISKDFLTKKKVKNAYLYGETPLTTLDLIARHCRILAQDTVYELGCGSARTCFWLRIFIRCKVVGIDYLPLFIHKAQWIKQRSFLHNIELIQNDILHVPLDKATVIYLYGTCLEECTIKNLMQHLDQLKPATKVITVSYPLTDYSDAYSVTKQFIGRFPWGKATIYLNEKK